MTGLKHPVTGHELTADKDSLEFWKAAGYQESSDSKPAAKKAPAKKAAAKKTSK